MYDLFLMEIRRREEVSKSRVTHRDLTCLLVQEQCLDLKPHGIFRTLGELFQRDLLCLYISLNQ